MVMNDTEHEHVCGTNHRGSTMNGDGDGEADRHHHASSASPLACSDMVDHASPSTPGSSPTSSAERHQHHRRRRRRQQQHAAVAGNAGAFLLLLGVIVMAVTTTMTPFCPSTVNAFTSPLPSSSSSSSHRHRHHDQPKADIFRSSPTSTSSSSSSSSRLGMSLHEVSDFYATYPLQSAILTCGFKASIADSIAQFKDRMKGLVESHEHDDNDESDNWWEARRNTAYVIYGGLFVGLMCHMEYNVVFPAMFGTENTPTTFISKVLFDNFISAPLMWLPPAYLIKAVLYDYSLGEGLEKYWRDIRDEGLLQKYWTIWVPAQTVSFSVVPDHLRVAFMASISFFWFILFSSVSSNGDRADATSADNSDAVSPTSDHSDAAIEASFFDQPVRKSQTMSFESLHDLYHQDIGVILEAEATLRVKAQNGSARSSRT
eukprot:CAMPEP_0113454516 /NCGR_PEP_ID=MMETSP0014_2-20120614/7901_1 /TAXON_ID=2857 /ORGANISM="Nitzschia sp." /LENGTH=429 /DNA_ID=CAMNT_0000345919 /DNA_START=149 /DNA_END=1438 /DNA_ORIENTATION=+ /assembly_acc=CAM_ASM_000159